jgi:hypothetical protein
MKHLLAILLATFCAATGYAQTIRALGYNSTNGQIVAATNVVWTNAFSVSTHAVAAQVRTNLQVASSTNSTATFGFGHASDRALALINNDSGANVLFYDSIGGDGWAISNATEFQSALFSTNAAPTNATNAAAWISIQIGTNSYRVPLYQ